MMHASSFASNPNMLKSTQNELKCHEKVTFVDVKLLDSTESKNFMSTHAFTPTQTKPNNSSRYTYIFFQKASVRS